MNSLRSPLLRAVPALFLVLALASCATLAPGADPIVVNAERVLKVAPSVYDGAMTFAHSGVKFSPEVANVLERFRTGFPPLYRSADSALATYKATKTGDLNGAVTALELALVEANAAVVGSGGPSLLGGGK